MGVQQIDPNQTRNALPGEVPPLRARDIEQVIEPGIDVGFVKREPATRLNALRGRMKVVQHGRMGRQVWIGILILALVVVSAILGFQLF